MHHLSRVLAVILTAATPVFCSPISASVHETRQSIPCADPAQSQEYISGYNAAQTYHVFTPKWDFINDMTTNGVNWILQGPAFKTWRTLSDMGVDPSLTNSPTVNAAIVALWQITNNGAQNFRALVAGPSNGTVPSLQFGYTAELLRGYAYAVSICGSVPLRGLLNQAKSDSYFTASELEWEGLVGEGWQDVGVIGYVLPV
ncbi:hypothetical protein CVT26_005286 [Gymnopilus dilepis]|uniref:DUF5648 domain-containing protein n=1 Tax=Gymnopilus dilepis TaxID=231916 RepID=A0A409YSU6_9AGAR|nr:hypothetical protein CVT26_005286 [Gymnopilus dilepis]